MVCASWVDAMLIRDDLPELQAKTSKKSTASSNKSFLHLPSFNTPLNILNLLVTQISHDSVNISDSTLHFEPHATGTYSVSVITISQAIIVNVHTLGKITRLQELIQA